MKYRPLGRSGLQISSIGLGCASFGTPQLDAAAVSRVVSAAVDGGINYFDTADVYGGVGRSEVMLGEALAGLRDRVLIATKFGLNTGPGINDYGSSRHHIMRACEASLKRLRTDVIDVYQVHIFDHRTPIEETLRALDDLVTQGKVRYLGCSNFSPWQICESRWISEIHSYASFVLTQEFYNLLYREVEAEMVPFCLKYGIGLVPYFPLAGAMLTDSYSRDVAAPPGSRGSRPTFKSWGSDRNWSMQEQLRHLAAARGCSLAQFSIAWLLSHPYVPTVIAGADNPEHIHLNIAAAEMELSAAELNSADAITLIDQKQSGPPIWRTQPPVRWPR